MSHGDGALHALLERLEAVLPAQAPIRDFVHHNPLHAFQHLPFAQAVAAAAQRSGQRGFATAPAVRSQLASGRVDRNDLAAAFAAMPALAAETPLGDGAPGLCRGDLYMAALAHDLASLDRAGLRYALEETEALSALPSGLDAAVRERHQAQAAAFAGDTGAYLRDLWQALLTALQLTYAPMHPEALRPADHRALATQAQVAALAHERLDALLAEVGPQRTLADFLQRLTGQQIFDNIRPRLIAFLGAFLDLGFSPWPMPAGGQGFYAAWKALARTDPVWGMIDLPEWHQIAERLPDDATTTLAQELRLLGVAETDWAAYLENLALTLPGWSGMFLQREHRAHAGEGESPVVRLRDLLAVLLVMERAFAHGIFRRRWQVEPTLAALRGHFRAHPAEFVVREALFGERLPEHLVAKARRLTRQATFSVEPLNDDDWFDVARHILAWRARVAATASGAAAAGSAHADAWPLFRLALALGLDGSALRRAGTGGVLDWLAHLRTFDAEHRGQAHLLAYEHHYRQEIFAGLAANRADPPPPPVAVTAQLIFCMDDREEGIRRHLEEIDPGLVTLGAAGFFGVAMYWQGLDETQPSALCPVVVTPAHRVTETTVAEAPLLARHRRRQQQLAAVRTAWADRSRRGVLGSTAGTALAAVPATLGLLWRTLAPAHWQRQLGDWRRRFDPPLPTHAEFSAATGGFSDAEQAARVAGLLRTIGLTRDFAPLVVLFGHGSTSLNNPHLSAYDCGACSGRHGGPNARVFAAMANRPEVRAQLAELGIAIADGTWFLGAERNTADESVTWYDRERLPPSLAEAFAQLQVRLAEASRRHARERCRRFDSAPRRGGALAALGHLAARSADFSQARPELGHATNAVALIGRRTMSRGLFLDRRAFLISYDPTADAGGEILESILLAAGPVGAGINLEYYFSTVNNAGYGCGSKTVHNLNGLFGVMEGAESDLRTGLPSQMIEIHEAMRLLVVVEQTTAVATLIYQRAPVIRELVGNGWLVLAAMAPDDGALALFEPGCGWLPWTGTAAPVARAASSAAWVGEARLALPPALIRPPAVAAVGARR